MPFDFASTFPMFVSETADSRKARRPATHKTRTMTANLTLTPRAAEQIRTIAAHDGAPAILRIGVEGGGCSGFQYKFDLVAKADQGDLVIERDGARLVVDQMSLLYLAGAEVDFVDELVGSAFRINNPNAAASCGCGTSFSI